MSITQIENVLNKFVGKRKWRTRKHIR